MILKFAKRPSHSAIPSELMQAIEDAVLLGSIEDLDAVLAQIEDEEGFPDEIVYGLQGLRYFRAHYGRDGSDPPVEITERQKAYVLESSWGSELLEMLREMKYPGPGRA